MKVISPPTISPAERHLNPKVKQAAEGMEEMFIDYMMQTMRKTVPENEFSLESNASRTYRALLDSEIAKDAAKSGGVGIAQQIVDYLESTGYPVYEDSAPSTGGTHANTFKRE